jgi:putative ABC transport system ATP-binding protein
VLQGVNASFDAGELSLLVGPSGCGKTTLISIIAGVLSATTGQVEVFGRQVTAMRPSELLLYRRRTVGFIFQQFNLLPTLTAAENACLSLAAAGISKSHAVEQASEMLNRIGMGDHLAKLPSQLSGGQQQRVAIARALVHEPKLLVCDEPTSALDARTGHQVMELLREVGVAHDRACIVVTHDSRVFDLADRIVEMEDGLAISPSTLLKDNNP